MHVTVARQGNGSGLRRLIELGRKLGDGGHVLRKTLLWGLAELLAESRGFKTSSNSTNKPVASITGWLK